MRYQKQSNIVKVTPETDDDLWLLSQVISADDHVRARTFRKITIGDAETDRNVKTVRKPMTLTIQTEKVEFMQGNLRVLGTIAAGPEDVNKGDHHSFTIEAGDRISIQKERWPGYILQRLDQAARRTGKRVLICAFDREVATFALASEASTKILTTLRGSLQKKADVKQITTRYSLKTVLLASPAFWKEYLQKELDGKFDDLRIITGTINSAGEQGIVEITKRPEMQTALANTRISEESQRVEDLLQAIAQDKAVCYGLRDCEQAAKMGAVEVLLVSESWIQGMRSKNDASFEKVMEAVEHAGGTVHLVGDHDAGKKLEGLGGIAGVLRYAIS